MSFEDGFKVTVLKDVLLARGDVLLVYENESNKKNILFIYSHTKERKLFGRKHLNKKIFLFLNLIRESSTKTLNHHLPYWMPHLL